MADKFYPKSNLPIRRSVELLPVVFQTKANDKFLSGVLDPLVQPGVLDKVVGYIGRRYDKTYSGTDIYVDSDNTLRSRYQLEPGVVYKNQEKIENFYDYLDFKNQLKFFGNDDDRDDKITSQDHYTWNPPIDWDKFINYREYFWVPNGAPTITILGQSTKITSTYKVVLGTTKNSFVFTPDAYTNNPTITLYRGQTYKFKVNAPGEGISIRTNYDTGSLLFRPYYGYSAGSLVVYDSKLWRAKQDVNPGDGSSITLDSQDWEYVEPASVADSLEYAKGVTNNGIQNGTLTFTVPYDAPDVLFYQGNVTPDCFGRFLIADIESSTYINVDSEIIGKSTYTSSNGISLSNGMIIEFLGTVSPSKYSSDSWLVEGVGKAITLTKFSDLIVPVLTSDVPEILFDNEGFDTEPFDDASAYPTYKDYITICRDSNDRNPWSRYNRWFHRSVLEQAYSLRGQDFAADETSRAKRPIIEFKSNLQLFNNGSIAKQTVDYVDTYTTDVFSTIEGSTGYNVDGEFLFEGARILVIADSDSLTNNKIYKVSFITHNGRKQIHLLETEDSESTIGECVLIRRGNKNSGKMYHYTGVQWVSSQEKTTVNQQPLFDLFDNNQVSFSDPETYPTSTFIGTPLFGYKEGTGKVDTELGFKLSYLNINNVGDIQFEWNLDKDSFQYTLERIPYSKKIATGFYKFNPNNTYDNGWLILDNTYIQPIIDSQIVTSDTTELTFNTIIWENLTSEPTINLYVDGLKYTGMYTRTVGTFKFSTVIKANSVVSIKVITDLDPYQGFYELPAGLEKNPFNDSLTSFTLGQAIDHITTSLEFNTELTGIIPGNSNLRDISGYELHAKRFLKHSGLAPLTIMTLCDKTHNVIKSIQYAKKAYTDFKNNFLAKAIELEYNNNVVDFVDDIINSLSRTKNKNDPFSDSDMIGAGAYTNIVYAVDDIGIKTFSLSTKFDLNTLSRNAVYIYLNDQQLLHSRDYEFNSTFGFVKLLVNLAEGDVVEIKEYVSTATNYIPPTPTSMGLYKKYTPMKFLDDTFAEPRWVIQGHDGSIMSAFDDFRDDLLLELEYRIYNNIKQEYNESVFNIDEIVGGYYYPGLYQKDQLDQIAIQEFLKWIQNTNINYTLNEFLDTENSFTYTYSEMTDPTGKINLPGYWRGVYKWFYDTDRPHRCPWEMLGFSEQPTWWESQYGAAPYTSGNLLLWEDLSNGIIRQGTRAGTYDRYKRPSLLSHIPVDIDGKLLSPLDSGLARDFSLINNKGPFVLGDIGPVEYGWRSTSEWPFAVILAMCLLKPFEFITDSFDRSRTVINKLGQTIHGESGLFNTIDDILQHDITDVSVGLVKYLIDYTKSRGISADTLWTKIANLDVLLSYRMSGFVDKQQQKFLLDSKTPSSTSSSIYVPQENYDIIFNVSSPIASVTYSGVILEKIEGGWVISGYDDIHPYFNYHSPLVGQRDPLISVGGVSEKFTEWEVDKNYNNGTLVRYRTDFYRALKTHNSGASFESANWKKLGDIPKLGAVEAFKRKTFNTLSIKKLSYGSKLTTIQAVVDFLLGYESYLKSVGFVFDNYDAVNKISQDWTSSSKEFMFWTKHNWEIGSLISLSPAAEKINIIVPVGVADNITDGFYDYQILKGDGKTLPIQNINVNRSFQNVTVETTNTTDGIYYLKLYYVLKEHVTVFDDRTVFNDIIYDKTTGYRQGRIKMHGFRTTDWDGDYTSPGFLFDNVNIQVWQPWTDYKLGDIVSYKSYNWTSLTNQLGAEDFDPTYWSKLDTTPEKQLISNFDYKIKQFADYFEVSTEGLNQSQRQLARHTIGYQQRDYLQNLAEDPVTQFQLYQGFIREKGTANSITKIFEKLSRAGTDSVELNEEWAFLTGRLGGTDQTSEIEIQIEKNKLQLNPQLFLVDYSLPQNITDQNYRLTASDFTISPIPYSPDINPLSLEIDNTFTAGYVLAGQYQHTLTSKSELSLLDIETVNENDHIWITFDNDSWTVIRVNESPVLYATAVERINDTAVEVTLSRYHNLAVDEYVGIRNIINLTGFFKITAITNQTITVEVLETADNPEIDGSSAPTLHLLTDCRFDSYKDINQGQAALYNNGSIIFVDSNEDNLWEVVEKTKQYTSKSPTDYGIALPTQAGSAVVYDNVNKHVIGSIPQSGIVTVHVENTNNLILKQIISPPVGTYYASLGSFGNSLAVSPDGKFLIIGSPEASGIKTNYRGEWEPNVFYYQDDIVIYDARLWKAVNPNSALPDGSSNLAINTDDWEVTDVIPVLESGRDGGLYNQGMIAIYEYSNGSYSNVATFVSPRPADNEKFGTQITIGKDGTNYYMAVSAVGSYNNTGRVYLFNYDGTTWTTVDNPKYRGEYNFLETYHSGDIVWQAAQDPVAESVRGNLWVSVDDSTSDGSTITLESSSWLKVSGVSTTCSLPMSVSVEDDGSTLEFAYTGLLSENQMAEIVKPGDKYGSSMAMSNDGRILVIGSPYADGQYFANYRGVWRPDVEYIEGEVVRYNSGYDGYQYYRLGDAYLGTDSTYRSYNEDPSASVNWQVVGDSTTLSSGKMYVYERNSYGSFEFKQMINADSISSFTDVDSGIVISTGDQFGFSMDIDATGNTLVVSSPKADINYQDQGSVYVFGLDTTSTEFRLKQRLESFEVYPNEYFGYGISISPDGEKIVVGARNTETRYSMYFDILDGTSFDNSRTRFHVKQGYTGGVYVFDKKDQTFFLTEKIEEVLSPSESFGYSIDCVGSKILVGSPYYREPSVISGVTTYSNDYTGKIRLFQKDENKSSWNLLTQQKPLVDIRKIRSIELYNNVDNVKIQDIDYIDSAKGKILNIAEKEIKFKTPYDPAVYSIGTDTVVVDTAINWLEKNVGQLWWDISKAKWFYAEQEDYYYRQGNWNELAPGASIDVYEWVETPLLPSEWAALADTNEGLAENISGQPLYPNDDVYSVKYFYSPTTGAITETLYYYWIKSKSTIPPNMPGRTKSAGEVASLISTPAGTGTPFVAIIDSDKFITYNFDSIISSDTALINIRYKKDLSILRPIHSEYQLITEGVSDSLPNASLENKWLDSLVGSDTIGNRVPDINLPEKQKYGISFRPKQTMFVDRVMALKIAVEYINTVLMKEAFADTINFVNLNQTETVPSEVLNLYDVSVDTEIDLIAVGTVRTKRAVLQVNLVNGEMDTIDIVDPGFGYKVVPSIVIEGDGYGAAAELTLDNQGRVSSVNVTSRGKKYSTITATVRYFSVLVKNDSTINNFWSIYAWDNIRKTFFRSRSQTYNTPNYWNYVDWWKDGYDTFSRIKREFVGIYDEAGSSILIGDLIRIKEFGSGGWAVFEKVADVGDTFLDRYVVVGRENGTFQILASAYDTTIYGIGFDNTQPFDTSNYDIGNAKELRNIFKALKEDIFVGEYAVEWNKLFFSSIRYILSEQQYVDWVFKTSFLNAIHNIGEFDTPINYKNDNLESYQTYINEVKPFRTTVREYVSKYSNIESYGSSATDFDLPPVYSSGTGEIIPVTTDRSELSTYPWKWWEQNHGYTINSISVYKSGTGYRTPPKVLIEGTGTGATAQAYISNGKVSGIVVLTEGTGYTTAPTITLVGGNSSGDIQAKAVAILGNSKARSFDLSIKFDRITKTGVFQSYDFEDTIYPDGKTSVFELKYAPSRDKNKISVYKNDQILLNNEYSISLYYASSDSYSLLRGKLILVVTPEATDVIKVVYEKNVEILDAVNRINRLYNPVSGMSSKDLNQLMTGIDFGGVQIQGTTFDVTGGWDALPWFTDNWDSVESNSDYYYVVNVEDLEDSSKIYSEGEIVDYKGILYKALTETVDLSGAVVVPTVNADWQQFWEVLSVTLPFIPNAGQEITVYWKKVSQRSSRNINTLGDPLVNPTVVLIPEVEFLPPIRIDDLYYNETEDSSTSANPTAQMPTFIGDGITNKVEIGQYISARTGDILIFRPIESDGSVTINDENLLDTKISGGSLSAIDSIYVTATGTTSDEIAINGGKFISPEHVPSTEEHIPGQVLDSVSIKVYQNSVSASATLQSKIIESNGTDTEYAIGQTVLENKSVFVYVDKIKKLIDTDYTLNLENYTVNFNTIPAAGSIIEILSIGIGGLGILDYQEFVADGTTNLFLTNANYDYTSSVFATVNGSSVDVGFKNSTDVTDAVGRTLVEFGTTPTSGDVIKIVCLEAASDVDSSGLSIIKVNTQTVYFEGSTRSFDLDEFVNLTRGTARNSMIVEANGVLLNGSDTTYDVYDGTTNKFTLGLDPYEAPGAILPANIKVWINNELKELITDYVFEGPTKILTINTTNLNVGDIIKIQNDLRADYSVEGNNLIINDSYSMTTTDETDNIKLDITWFSEYPTLDIVFDKKVGGKVQYKLSRTPVSASYVWVYKNGIRLTLDKDYYVSLPKSAIYLKEPTTPNDYIQTLSFSDKIYRLPAAFEIHKDMLNVYHYNRSSSGVVELATSLNYYDTTITVNDSSTLTNPLPSRNVPGIVNIAGERIEYMSKVGNVLSQLRRGSQGTSIGEVYAVGTSVIDVGYNERLPYNETQERLDFVSDGSTLLVGPLDFTPTKGTRSSTWYRSSIPTTYGPCDQVEIFAAGRRLRKDPISVWAEENGAYSPTADEVQEAEFSVNGSSVYIRLTEPQPAGTRITVIRKLGKTWYDRGETTASTGVTLLDNSSPIAKFIAQKSTSIPE